MLSETHIRRLYAQGADPIIRVIHRLEDQLEDAAAQLIRSPQPLIARLSKELALAHRTLARQRDELIQARQLNHQLLRRLRELEREVERGDQQAVARDSHNSSLPPSSDPPWQQMSRTTSLRKRTGRKPGGQFGHRGTTLRQVAQPDQLIVHTPETCTGCGTPLQHSAPTISIRRQVFDISDGRVKVTEHRAETRRCAACATLTKAKFPAQVRAPVSMARRSFTLRLSASLSTAPRREGQPASTEKKSHRRLSEAEASPATDAAQLSQPVATSPR